MLNEVDFLKFQINQMQDRITVLQRLETGNTFADWQEAVADGKTTLEFQEWINLQESLREDFASMSPLAEKRCAPPLIE